MSIEDAIEAAASGDDDDREAVKVADSELPLCFTCDRHVEPIEGKNCETQTWRMKERMKTVSVALVLCLNVGVDPPDVVKTQPCARLECWIDPLSMPPSKALDQIGAALQSQYERWQPGARYKISPDPTAEDVKKLCTSLRRNAKEERVLFHYNGHGVPKPTTNGEIWVFNRTYTQYVPLSIYDLQTWMGAPSIYVYDCSNAGIIVESFKQFALQHESEYEQTANSQARNSSPGPPNYRNCIQLAACGKSQVLPMNPDFPADLFTACLTTPIKIALRWFVMQSTSKLVPKVTMDLVDKIPGQITDRRTMLGELNWIFTAITDTIAWNTLPRDLFQKLFRQDLLVASLFRNFLLAERIMRSCDCTPVSAPPLPTTYQHPMWNAWDLTLDLSLGQLPGILDNDEPFQHLPFFEEQLTAFQVWLDLGSEHRTPPEQLPIVLQVLLSQVHRMRALELLGRFLDLGPWAVNLALSVGIFPYVLKLLQSCAKELRPLLVFIWAKILAVDNTCQADLVRDNGHKYFLSVLQDMSISHEHRTQSAFVLACIVNKYRDGQEAARQGSLVSICLEQLHDPSPHLRQWVAICLGRLWDHYEKARWTGVRDIAHEKLYTLLKDPCPEVRAAAVYALGTFINSVSGRSEHANTIDHSIVMTLINNVCHDMSSLVRSELVVALQWVVLTFEHYFVNVAAQEARGGVSGSSPSERSPLPPIRAVGSRERLIGLEGGMRWSHSMVSLTHAGGTLGTLPGLAYGSVYMKIWSALCNLEVDPHPDVSGMCKVITGHVRRQVKEEKGKDSVSLPPSPNGPGFMGGAAGGGGDSPRNNVWGYGRARRLYPQSITEESDDGGHVHRKPLVSTQFVEWSCKRFAQPVKKGDGCDDPESQEHYQRDWRYTRNNKVRREATIEQRKVINSRLESQVFSTKCSFLPSVLQFHPYDQQIAIAGKESFYIIDWGTGAKMTHCQCKSTRGPNSRITSMEWVNAHDLSLVMTAFEDSSVKVWRPNIGGSREVALVSAWQAFNEPIPIRTTQTTSAGVLLAWEQYTQTVITCGDSRTIGLWDVERELKAYDLPIGADCSVTCVDSTFAGSAHEYHPCIASQPLPIDGLVMGELDEGGVAYRGPKMGLVVVGCADGSIRLYDRRCAPNDARVRSWSENTAYVLGVQMRGFQVVSGSVQGDVRVYDIRKPDSLLVTQAVGQNSMTAFSVHRGANIYACGSVSPREYPAISVHHLAGHTISTIRWSEGFMGYRTGPVSLVTFHPHKVALAAATADCSVSVYSLDSRR